MLCCNNEKGQENPNTIIFYFSQTVNKGCSPALAAALEIRDNLKTTAKMIEGMRKTNPSRKD